MNYQVTQVFFSLSQISQQEHMSRSILESMMQDPRFPVVRMSANGRFYIPQHAISYMETVGPIADDMRKWVWDWNLPEAKLLTISQFRHLMGCSETTVYDVIRAECLNTKLIAKRLYIVTKDLQPWLDDQCRREHNLIPTNTRRK